MAIASKTQTQNATLDSRYDTLFPAGSKFKLYTGAAPGPNNAPTGTLLGTITLPASPWAAAAGGSKSKQGVWSDVAVAAGNAGYFRLENAAGTHIEEGTIGVDATIDNASLAIGQGFSVSTFTRTSA